MDGVVSVSVGLANATFHNNALKYRAFGSLPAPVTSVSVNLRTREENGVLLRSSNGLESFCMGLLNSSILLKIGGRTDEEALAFTSEVEVSDGAWHRVELRKMDVYNPEKPWNLLVDGRDTNFSGTWGPGAGAGLDFLNHSVIWLAENFTGCLGEVRIGGVYLPLVTGLAEEVPQFSRFTLFVVTKEARLGCRGAPVCLSQPCLNNGSCQDLFNHYGCKCAPGWEGENCQDDVDECTSGPCVNGVCRDLPGGYQCQCDRGYGGRRCDEDVDECQELPCENRGSCVNSVGGFGCICPPEYDGPLCQ